MPAITVRDEGRTSRTVRTAKDPVKLRRAIVVLMSAQGQSVPDIAHLLDCSAEHVRGVIHAFSETGFKALDPKWSGGRPRTISEQARRRICLIARCCRDLGLAFSTWELKQARGVPGRRRRRIGQPGKHPADPALWRGQLAGHQDLEGLHRSGLPAQNAPCAGSLRSSVGRRAGDLRR
jgi:transposase